MTGADLLLDGGYLAFKGSLPTAGKNKLSGVDHADKFAR